MARRVPAIDRENQAASVAVDLQQEATRGVARYARVRGDPDAAETAVVVEDAHQGVELGGELLLRLAGHTSAAVLRRLVGSFLGENDAMLALLRALGFAGCERPGLDAIAFEPDLPRRSVQPSPASCSARWTSGRTA